MSNAVSGFASVLGPRIVQFKSSSAFSRVLSFSLVPARFEFKLCRMRMPSWSLGGSGLV